MLTRVQVDRELDRIRRIYFERGDLRGTLIRYRTVLIDCQTQGAEEDAFAICCRDIADILYALDRKEEAFRMYDRALGYNVLDKNVRAQTLMNKGISLIQEGKQNDAEPFLKEACEISTPPFQQTAVKNYQLLLKALSENNQIEVYFETQRQRSERNKLFI